MQLHCACQSQTGPEHLLTETYWIDLLYVYECSVHTYGCEDSTGSPATGAMHRCALPSGCWDQSQVHCKHNCPEKREPSL